MKKNIIILLLSLGFFACNSEQTNHSEQETTGFAKPIVQKVSTTAKGLDNYWYQGKAEINRYELQQNRYKDVHPGEAILVFVTEDFLTDKQVKNDNYRNPNSTPILKNNFIRKFPTGIYDYSIMSSIFTPVQTDEFPNTLKVTTSSQEWCGHTFMQLNKKEQEYAISVRSYFENENDTESTVPLLMIEDEIYNRIRMNPEALPTGKFRILPGTVITRLMHLPFNAQEVSGILANYKGSDFKGKGLKSYTLKYPTLNRTLEIVFKAEAPFEIIGWTDSYPSAFDREVRKTIARRTHSILSAYWNKNGLNDMALRKELGI